MDKLIGKLKDLNIRLKLVEGKLKINAPKGVVTKEIIEEIKANKEDLIRVIENYAAKESFFKIPKAEDKDYYELSLAQKRIYFTYLLNPQTTAYNMPQFYNIKGKLDIKKLEMALQTLVNRHESFRTVFTIVDDEPVQRILPEVKLEMKYHLCEGAEIEKREAAFARPFDLSKGELIRAELLKIGVEDYRLLIDIHHIINDGESNNIILEDIVNFYDGNVLEDLDTRYRDYSEWQNSPEFQKKLVAQKDFWKSRFVDFPGLLDLTLDYKREWDGGSSESEYLAYEVNATKTKALKSIVEKEGTTMFILVLAILNVLFAKITNEEDITIGSPVAGRHHPDLKGIVGMFVNSLPLRNYPKNNLSFKDFLAGVTASVIDSFDNQDFHYEQLINELKLERVGDRNPLFNILYTFINFISVEKGEAEENQLDIVPYMSIETHSKFDFSITAIESEHEFHTNFHYNSDVFGLELIERIISYYENIIQAIIENSEIKIGDIDILTTKEREQLLKDFNDTKVIYPKDKTILDLLEEQAEKTPDSIALIVDEEQLTYQDLHAKANQLAHYLVDHHGIEKGMMIGLFTTRSASMIIGMLAILKTGAAYIPIDPKATVPRISNMVADSKMKLILTDQNGELEGLKEEVKRVDLLQEKEQIDLATTTSLNVNLSENDLAYLIYTSGSTGQPKGVLIEHVALMDYSLTFQNYFSVSAEDRVIQQASLAFDTAVEEIFPTLISGAALLLIPQGGLDIEYIVDTIENKGATILSTTPLVLNELNAYAKTMAKLRVVISGGDLLLPAHVNKIIKNQTIYNTYGPSESTVCITYNKIEKTEDISFLGKPIANRQVYITNLHGDLCPVLVPGELCVSGKGLARGYLNKEQLTKEKFVDNPFHPGQRMYKTGDFVRWLPDGNIEFLGRIDQQVKIRGVRIELGEIENCLINHEKIQEVVVTVKEKEGEKYLVAYYVGDEELSAKVLVAFLAEELPLYMVPAHFVHIEKIPQNSNGKPDLKKLPSPEIKIGGDFEAPSSEIAEKLAAIWAEILKLDKNKISVNRSFFELGGHSLKAISLISKMEKSFGVKIKLRTVFTKPTILDLENNILMAKLAKKTKNTTHKVII